MSSVVVPPASRQLFEFPSGLTLGLLLAFDREGSPLINFEGNPTGAPQAALSCVSLSAQDLRCYLAIGFLSGNKHWPIVLGVIRRSPLIDGDESDSNFSTHRAATASRAPEDLAESNAKKKSVWWSGD